MGQHFSLSDLDGMPNGAVILVAYQHRVDGVPEDLVVPILKMDGTWHPPGCFKPVHEDPFDLIDGYGQPDTGTIFADVLASTLVMRAI